MVLPLRFLRMFRNQIFPAVFDQLSKGCRELDKDREMVLLAKVCTMFVDWTDPQKAMYESDTTLCA